MELLIKLQKVLHRGFIRDYYKTLEDKEREKLKKQHAEYYWQYKYSLTMREDRGLDNIKLSPEAEQAIHIW